MGQVILATAGEGPDSTTGDYPYLPKKPVNLTGLA